MRFKEWESVIPSEEGTKSGLPENKTYIIVRHGIDDKFVKVVPEKGKVPIYYPESYSIKK